MRQLLYASNTSLFASDTMLADILAASRNNNIKAGITGILLYIEGGFMQVLEGDDFAVTATLDRISSDRRHWNTTILLDREAPRSFAEWSMGFLRVAKGAEDGVFELTEDALRGRLGPNGPAEIVSLLRTFYRINAPQGVLA